MKLEDYCYAKDIDMDNKNDITPQLDSLRLIAGQYSTYRKFLQSIEPDHYEDIAQKEIPLLPLDSQTVKGTLAYYETVAQLREAIVWHEALIENPLGVSSSNLITRLRNGDDIEQHEFRAKHFADTVDNHHEFLQVLIDDSYLKQLRGIEPHAKKYWQKVVHDKYGDTVDFYWYDNSHSRFEKLKNNLEKQQFETIYRQNQNQFQIDHPSLQVPALIGESFRIQSNPENQVMAYYRTADYNEFFDGEELILNPYLEKKSLKTYQRQYSSLKNKRVWLYFEELASLPTSNQQVSSLAKNVSIRNCVLKQYAAFDLCSR